MYYACVFTFRVLSVAGWVFFFPLFQEATHELFQIRGVAFGGPLMWFVDFGIQLGLIRHVTEDRSKLPFAVANTVSPAEPLLQDAGGPILTAWPLLIVTIHLLEWSVGTLVVCSVHGRDDLTEIFQDDPAIVFTCVWCTLVVVPFLSVLRCCCAWKCNAPTTSTIFLIGRCS